MSSNPGPDCHTHGVPDSDHFPRRDHAGWQARATHGAWHGTWYFEARMTHLGKTGHCRLGWSTRKGELQAPVGYDMYRRARGTS